MVSKGRITVCGIPRAVLVAHQGIEDDHSDLGAEEIAQTKLIAETPFQEKDFQRGSL